MTARPDLLSAPAVPRRAAAFFSARRLDQMLVPALGLIAASLTLVVAWLAIVENKYDVTPGYAIPVLGGLAVILEVMFIDIYRQHGRWDFAAAGLGLGAFVGLIVLRRLPEYITGGQLHLILHRSVPAAVLLLGLGLPALCLAIYYLLGATPWAEDMARYPLVLAPVVGAVAIYVGLLLELAGTGLANLTLKIVQTPYMNVGAPFLGRVLGAHHVWPMWMSTTLASIGLRHYLLGTGLLMLLTTAISLPIGVAAGLYLGEYGDNVLGSLVRFSITALRGISTLALALAALSVLDWSSSTPLASLLHGTHFNGWFDRLNQGGSFLLGGLVISVLVIPIVVRATEEGCRALPSELREGSAALGATDETTLWRVVLPWALPNIVTAALLGCIEAAGAVTVLWFLAGRGDYGVGLFREVTSVATMIFELFMTDDLQFRSNLGPYQLTAGALLLVLTMGLGTAALLLKRWLYKRFRGG